VILVWSNTARNDLKQLNAYIGQDSPVYARQFIQRMLARVEGLSGFPNLGRRVPEADRDDIREIVFQGYRIIYQTAADHIRVLTVLHGSRDLNNTNNRPWET
jgi:plasmid stabilization system protein ParE